MNFSVIYAEEPKKITSFPNFDSPTFDTQSIGFLPSWQDAINPALGLWFEDRNYIWNHISFHSRKFLDR